MVEDDLFLVFFTPERWGFVLIIGNTCKWRKSNLDNIGVEV